MGLSLCKCCWTNRNKITDSDNRNFNILLLGLENVGKTEIGYILAGKRRTHYEPTNGVHCYEVDLPNYSMSITEIGGNSEMQKLWHHYYAKTMGLIFCYDMSAIPEEMKKSFQILNRIASHPFMRGKAILLIGTKSDLVSDTIQLYDIENTFAVEELANRYFSSLKSTHFNPNELDNLWSGVHWLTGYLEITNKRLKGRIKYDTIKENINKKRDSQRKRFRLSYRRPRTAPASFSPGCVPPPAVLLATKQSKNTFQIADQSIKSEPDEVPTNFELT